MPLLVHGVESLPAFISSFDESLGAFSVGAAYTARAPWASLTGLPRTPGIDQCVIRLKKLSCTFTAAADEMILVRGVFYTTPLTGGTSAPLPARPIDRRHGLSLTEAKRWTAAPTPGTVLGMMQQQFILARPSGTGPVARIDWDFTNGGILGGVALRDENQVFALSFQTAPVNAFSIAPTIEYCEEGRVGPIAAA